MKLKYHNKLEIEVGGRRYVSYNKVLRSIYTKIASFEPYASYFSLGIGTKELSDTDTKLGNYVMSLKTETTEISSDKANGVYYVKKTATIDSNDSSSFYFTELGISSNDDYNTEVYNHILIKDDSGNIVKVYKNPGESLVIKLTIFLELVTDDTTFLTLGENNLIKLLLGEELEDKTIYAVRGTNMTDNIDISRQMPYYTERFEATCLVSETDDGGVELLINSKLGEGATREIVFFINNQVVARTNVMNTRDVYTAVTNHTSNSIGNVLIDNYVYKVNNIKDMDGNIIQGYKEIKVAKSLGDEINIEGLINYDNTTQRFKSIDDNLIAFLTENKLSIYKTDNYNLSEIHSNAITVNGINNVCIFSNYVLVIKNIAPYIELYKIVNDVCEKQNLYKTNFEQSIYSYDFKDVKAVQLNNGDIVIGVILSNSNIGLALKIIQDEDGYNLAEINQSSLTSIDMILACNKTLKNDSKILFLSSTNDDPITPYGMQIYNGVFSSIGFYSVTEELFNADNVTTHGDYLLLHKNESPYLYSYDTVNFDRVSLADGFILEKTKCSSDMNYMFTTSSGGNVKMYLCLDQNNLMEMDTKLIDIISENNIVDVEIMDNMILIFLDNQDKNIRALLLDKNYTIIKNLTSNTDYVITYDKYDLLGSHEYEGVQISLNFKF